MIRGQDETRGRIGRERVVRLVTVGGRGRAHVAPGVLTVDGVVFCSPADAGQGRGRPGRWGGGSGCAAPAGESPERTHAIGLLEREYQQFAATPRRGWWPDTGARHRGLVRLGV